MELKGKQLRLLMKKNVHEESQALKTYGIREDAKKNRLKSYLLEDWVYFDVEHCVHKNQINISGANRLPIRY